MPQKRPKSVYSEQVPVPIPGAGCAGVAATNRVVLTAEGYKLVEALSAKGHSLATIAKAIGMQTKDFQHLRVRDPAAQEAVDRGRALMVDRYVSKLEQHINDGNVTALIFALKALGGLREGEPLPGASAKPTTAVQVNITIPGAMSDEEFKRYVDGVKVEAKDA